MILNIGGIHCSYEYKYEAEKNWLSVFADFGLFTEETLTSDKDYSRKIFKTSQL